jgi:hypothetical protein
MSVPPLPNPVALFLDDLKKLVFQLLVRVRNRLSAWELRGKLKVGS